MECVKLYMNHKILSATVYRVILDNYVILYENVRTIFKIFLIECVGFSLCTNIIILIFIYIYLVCGGYFHESNGTIRYPESNKTSTYMGDLNCLWVIDVDPPNIILLSFSWIDIEKSEITSDCLFAWVEVKKAYIVVFTVISINFTVF